MSSRASLRPILTTTPRKPPSSKRRLEPLPITTAGMSFWWVYCNTRATCSQEEGSTRKSAGPPIRQVPCFRNGSCSSGAIPCFLRKVPSADGTATLLKGLSDICIGIHLHSYYVIGISGHDSQFHHEESAVS